MCTIRLALAIFALIAFAGCSSNPPYHAVETAGPSGHDCAAVYQNELHQNYDLFFTEFDDEGWEADLRETRAHTEIETLFDHLQSSAATEKLDVVVYTNGWHGSSKSDNYYAVLFRAFLPRLAVLDNLETPPRHVIGILVGWRGDSIEFPSNVLSVWDRNSPPKSYRLARCRGYSSVFTVSTWTTRAIQAAKNRCLATRLNAAKSTCSRSVTAMVRSLISDRCSGTWRLASVRHRETVSIRSAISLFSSTPRLKVHVTPHLTIPPSSAPHISGQTP